MANLSSQVEYLEYDFHEAYLGVAGTAIAGTGAATNKLTATAHGLLNGQIVSVASIVTLANLAVNTQYYVVNKTADDLQLSATPGGSAIAIGNSGTCNILWTKRYRLYFPNKITPNVDKNTYEWKGGGRSVKLEQLAAMVLNLDTASVPEYVRSNIFSKASLTWSDAGLTATNVTGWGGGNEKSGVSTELHLKCYAKKIVSGSEIGIVTRFYNYPVGTLTPVAPRGPESGAVGAQPQFSFSATPGAADINGATIASMASDDYCISGELA
jgi:hypothetical protein